MPTSNSSRNERSSSVIGFVFIFNLIVGTGALTLPAVFAKSGWLLSLIVIIMLAVISYMTATFVIEAMACANAVRNWQNLQVHDEEADEQSPNQSDGENEELLGNRSGVPLRYLYYRLEKKFELGEMASLFFNDFGRMIFYLCLAIYLYGDLSIYAAAVAKTLRDIACISQNITKDLISEDAGLEISVLVNKDNDDDVNILCWAQHTLTRMSVYRIFLIGFIVILGPFTAFSIQKTKYLQIFTVFCRWLAFIFMISIAIKLLISDGVKGHPAAVNFYGAPSLFGACVYSFMCHHSLPSLLAPIRNKQKLRSILCADYALICLFYILLAMTGIFAFERLQDLYTLNFIPSNYNGSKILVVIDYFLALFPVFTLTASFPIVAITLRNNLQTLFLDMTRFDTYNFFVRRMLFPLATIIPPFIITYFTQNLTSLVSFTGNYAGTSIQYLIPICLVFYARRTCKELLGSGVVNEFQSSFRHLGWLLFVAIWSLACVGLVTVNFIS